jgi:hypothetical protein
LSARESHPPTLDVSLFTIEVQKARAPLKALINENDDRSHFLADDLRRSRAGKLFFAENAISPRVLCACARLCR